MNSTNLLKAAVATAIVAACAGCSQWQRMDTTEGAVAGGAGGAVAGAVVAGPVGAVVGGVGGAYAGHEMAKGGSDEKVASSAPSSAASRYDPALVRSVQQALNDKGYNAGPVDGQWGPATEDALTRFQQASGVAQTGAPDRRTLTALGVAQ
jgi:hypothetical protein